MYLCLLFLTDDCGTANMTGHRGLQHSLSVVVPRLVSVKCLSVGLILLLSFYFAWMTVTRLDESGTKLEDTGRHQYGWLQQSLSVVVPRLVSVKCPSIGLILLLSFYFAWMTVPRLDDKGRHQYVWLQQSKCSCTTYSVSKMSINIASVLILRLDDSYKTRCYR